MNRDEVRGRIEHRKEQLEEIKEEIKKTLKRIVFVTKEETINMKTIEFLKEEVNRLEGFVCKQIVLEGEIEKLKELYQNMPKENI